MWTIDPNQLRRAATRQREQAKAGREFAMVVDHQTREHYPATDGATGGQAMYDAAHAIRQAADAHEAAAQALTRAADALG